MVIAWEFIEKRAAAAELKNQLHAIWYLSSSSLHHCKLKFSRYCIPMDSTRPLLPTELEFFNKGTGKGKSSCLVS